MYICHSPASPYLYSIVILITFALNSQAVVMVVGAGRGPLVRSAFNASANVNRKIKMYVVEKNPNAIVTLSALQEEMWSNKGELCNESKAINFKIK